MKSEEYGKVLDASFERLSCGTPTGLSAAGLFDKSKSGLLPFDLHIHDLDVIVSLFGKPECFTDQHLPWPGQDLRGASADRLRFR